MVIKEEGGFCDCDVIHQDLVDDVRTKLLDKDYYLRLATLMKNFSDGTRIQILHALEKSELCVCDLAALLGVTKSAVSHQLRTLRMARLIKSRKEAQVVFYSLADDHVSAIIDTGLEHLREDE